jgi:TolB protein
MNHQRLSFPAKWFRALRTGMKLGPGRLSVGAFVALLFLLALVVSTPPARAQDWFRTGTGLGVSKPKVAVADFVPRSPQGQALSTLFSDVLRNDLDYSGVLELASKSFYPTQVPSIPSELNGAAWSNPPVSAQFLAFGNFTITGNDLSIAAWFNDVRNAAAPPVVGRVYHGATTEADTRKFAHQFADEIIAAMSGGVPGIASTQIAFVSARTGNKEIWAMDYDGSNQHNLTSLHSISLTPRWSPDAGRIAFTCYPTTGVVSAQICMYSMLTNKQVAWPRYKGTNSAPAWSPDGGKIMFMSSMYGNPELFIADADGSQLKRITYAVGASTSAAWNPKTGQQVAFVSDRGGTPQLYTMDADGGEVQKVPLPDMGYVIDPSWSPNGQLLAFSWRRPNGNYDIYAMDIATHQLVELTRDAARNERPSWAPDGRHLVFESTRTGTRQIWSMLADGTNVRQLTTQGDNESPNWSPK